MSYIALDARDLALASLLVVLNGGLSLALQLGLARQLAIATLRMIVQLLLVGLVLEALFGLVSPFWTGFAALGMLVFAGREVMARQERRLAGLWSYGLGTSCMLVAATLVTVFALVVQVNPDPWYHPRFALPLLGMVLGNTMTGVSLGSDRRRDGRRAPPDRLPPPAAPRSPVRAASPPQRERAGVSGVGPLAKHPLSPSRGEGAAPGRGGDSERRGNDPCSLPQTMSGS